MSKFKINPITGQLDIAGGNGFDFKYPTGESTGKGKVQSFFDNSINYTTKTFDSGYLITYPILVKSKTEIIKVRSGIASPAVGEIVWGIYEQGTDGLPNQLLFQTAPFNTNVGGTTLYTLPSPKVLDTKLYWVGFNTNSNAIGPATFIAGILTNIWSDMSASQYSYFYKPYAYTGTLPSTFGTGGIVSTGNTTINFCEFILP